MSLELRKRTQVARDARPARRREEAVVKEQVVEEHAPPRASTPSGATDGSGSVGAREGQGG